MNIQAVLKNEFLRNSLIFSVILILSASAIGYFLIAENKKMERIDRRVDRAYLVISNSQELSKNIEAMLSAQRGYLLSGEDSFLQQYQNHKNKISEVTDRLSKLTLDSSAQAEKLKKIEKYTKEFAFQLEQRTKEEDIIVSRQQLNDVEIISDIKSNIISLNKNIINKEYESLNDRIQVLEEKRDGYYRSLLIGGFISTILLLMLNLFLMRSQSRRGVLETSLKDTEERFKLALEGTQDGIFDWNIQTGEIFFSKQYFSMLGEDTESKIGAYEDFTKRVHPDDVDKVNEYAQLYLDKQLSEYSNVFRMKHQSGRYLWINARAQVIDDLNGKPLRMVGAHTDITPSKEYQEQLKKEKEQALKANKAKSEFLAHMSHEIRTPLTTISGIATILNEKKDELSDKLKPLASTLSNSSSSLKDLITDILDFSKIESGEIEIVEEAFEIDTVFEEVISMMAMRANEKGIKFYLDYSAVKDTVLLADKVRFRQILINVINNALKFTEEGSVTITAHKAKIKNESFLKVDVTDTGIGIDMNKKDIIFEQFKQADSSVSRKYGGTGLGLPISRNLADMMGGTLDFDSEVGKGSTFSLTIPFKTAENVEEEQTKEFKGKLNEKIKAALSDKQKILMVEDYEGNIVVLSFILEELGISFDVARTGREGLDAWKKHHYSVILMDVQMPEMDGFTATSEIRKLEEENNFHRTPIIGMTAHALVEDENKCLAAGMDAYLPKPIVEEDFKKTIFKYLKESQKAA